MNIRLRFLKKSVLLTLVGIVFFVIFFLFLIRGSNKTKASGNLSVTLNPSTGNYYTNEDFEATYTITAPTTNNKIVGLRLYLKTEGPLKIVDVVNVSYIGPVNGTFNTLRKQIIDQSTGSFAHLILITQSKKNDITNSINMRLRLRGTGQGRGRLMIATENQNNQIVGLPVPAVFSFNQPPIGSYDIRAERPPSPTNLSAVCEVNPRSDYIQTRITWQGVEGVPGYQLSKAKENRNTWNYSYYKTASQSSQFYSFVDREDSIYPSPTPTFGLIAGRLYFYNVASCFPDQNNCAQAYYASPEIQIKCPAPPTNLQVRCDNNRIIVSWSVSTEESLNYIDTFFVSRGVELREGQIDWNYNYAQVQKSGNQVNFSFTDEQIQPGQVYAYNVKSCLAQGSNSCAYQIYSKSQLQICCGQCQSASPTPTPTPTPNQAPITSPPPAQACICLENNTCSQNCPVNETSNYWPGAQAQGIIYTNPMKCVVNNLNLVYSSSPNQDQKNSFCNRQKRPIGDVNGDGMIGFLNDYVQFVQVVLGGKIPSGLNVDVNGDGVVSNEDGIIIRSNMSSF